MKNTAPSPALLDTLCQLAGIQSDYEDAWGHQVTVAPTVRQNLLAAMGLKVATAATAEAAAADLEQRHWRRPLDPVHVVTADEDGQKHGVVLALRLPRAWANRPLGWHLICEDGTVRTGTVRPDTLEDSASHTLDGTPFQEWRLPLPAPLPLGYHRFGITLPALPPGTPPSASAGTPPNGEELSLIVAPCRCHLPSPPDTPGRRHWGIAAQLYAQRSSRNWGIGDFTDLGDLLTATAALGGAAVGLNPLHALFPAWRDHIAPYSPSSRLFLNILYIDIEAVPEFAGEAPPDPTVLEGLRQGERVDYPAVAALKRDYLERLYRRFREKRDTPSPEASARRDSFRAFQEKGGRTLHDFALFEALSEHFAPRPWRDWPTGYHGPRTAESAAFAHHHQERLEFFQYLQWLADGQLEAAAKRAADLAMAIGLYHDLAVASDFNGFESWAHDTLMAQATIGAPPDALNLDGQDWGLPPFNPLALREQAYRPFIRLLRANMRHGGALRIDHVMSLARLYWIPRSLAPSSASASAPAPPPTPGEEDIDRRGGYVAYPLDDLVAIIALESQRHRCLVVGEDLGTVPPDFRARMQAAAILSYRLLYFQRDHEQGFFDPSAYPELAVAAVRTHDLPPLAAYWQEFDIDLFQKLELFDDSEAAAARAVRGRDRDALCAALARQGIPLPKSEADTPPPAAPGLNLTLALHRFLALSPARLLMVHPEDLLGDLHQINLPGTSSAYPNWQYRAPCDIAGLADAPSLRALACLMAREGRAGTAPPTMNSRAKPDSAKSDAPGNSDLHD